MPETTHKLTPTPASPDCDFSGTAGVVVLALKDVTGSVDFATAKYGGVDIPGTPAKKITFTIVAGKNDLEVVYAFTDPANGEAELREDGNANTLLRNVHAANKAVAYTICA